MHNNHHSYCPKKAKGKCHPTQDQTSTQGEHVSPSLCNYQKQKQHSTEQRLLQLTLEDIQYYSLLSLPCA